jgi:hypothetical protein
MADVKVVHYTHTHTGETEDLSVAEVMENDGRLCGPEWGWITLGEIVEHGFGLDTAPETWEAAVAWPLVVREMAAYWAANPDLDDEGYDAPPAAPSRKSAWSDSV